MHEANRILIIEDDLDFAALAARDLEEHDFSCESVGDVTTALKTAASGGFDMMLIDYHINELTVLDFLDQLDADEKSVPFVVMTGFAGDRRAVEIMKRGALDFIIKDDTFFELLPQVMSRVRDHVRNEISARKAEKARQQSHERLINLVSQALEPAYIVDLKGVVIESNEAFQVLVGCGHGEESGCVSLFDLFPGKEEVADFKNKLHRHGFVKNYEVLLNSPAGQTIEGQINARLFTDETDAIAGYQGFLKDISEQKRWERLLKDHKDELEQKNAQLEEVVQALKTFSDAIANDLRTPIWRVDGFAKMLQEELGGDASGPVRFLLDQIRSDGKRITQFINDAFRLSNIGRGDLLRKELSISAIAREIIDDLRVEAQQGEIAVNIESGITIEADERMLRIMLRLLLYYVWFYCQVCGAGSLEIKAGDETAEVVISVHGENLEHISDNSLFVPLYQAYLIKDYFQTGVSLVTVQRVISLHGGRIWLSKEETNLNIHFHL